MTLLKRTAIESGEYVSMARSDEIRRPPYDREAEELTIGPLLARANLLKMRHQWAEAVAVCTEAIRLAPRSAAAHSLMGHIYEEQGKANEAVTWYGLALDLDPDNAADRERWQQLTEAQRIRLREQSPALKSSRERTIEKTLGWIDRLFPPGQANTVTRMIYALCIAIAVLLVVSAVVVYLVAPLPRPATPAILPTLNAPPVVVPPPVLPRRTAERPQSEAVRSTPIPTPEATPSVVETPKPETGRALAEDVVLREALNQALGGTFTVVNVYRTTARNTPVAANDTTIPMLVTLDITVPTTPDWQETRERVLRYALQAGQFAMNADPRAERVVTRVALSGLSPRPAMVFAGELSRASIVNIDPEQSPLTDVLARFTDVRWIPLPVMRGENPGVSSPTEPASSPRPTGSNPN